MATLKPRSVRLPLLIALPVLVILGLAAVFLSGQEPPPPPHPPAPNLPEPDDGPPPRPETDPLQADPDPPPRPISGAPATAQEAEEMADEAWGALENIRARLELKYKGAEYKLDRGWTIELLMRRLDRLDGKHFRGTDFALEFPEGEEPVAVARCVTRSGANLPDGELKLTVNLRTGVTEKSGRLLARTPEGLILLGEREYARLDELIREALFRHCERQQAQTDGSLAPLDGLYDDSPGEPFNAASLSASAVVNRPLAVEFACRSLNGERLAEPAVVTLDYAAKSVAISSVSAKSWMPLPADREAFKNQCRWYLRILAGTARNALEDGTPRDQITLEGDERFGWAIRYAVVLPFDIKLTISESEPWTITLEVASQFGRPLPFKPLRYVTGGKDGRDGWEDGD